MKKKILFMLINMNIGGTEKALLNMISEMPKEKYEISILMLEEYGGFLDYIPGGIQVEYLKGYDKIKNLLNDPPQASAVNLFKKGNFIKAFNIIVVHVISKIKKERSIFFKYILKRFPKMEKEYDLAVAYAGPMDFISYFILNKVKAKKRVQWIHFDITKIGFDKHFASKIYNKFERIFIVSEEARNKLITAIPALKEKSEVFINIISPKLIQSQSKEDKGFQDNFDGLKILTVGRLTTEKGQDLAIRVLKKLIDNGYKVKWYCIGEGSSRGKYETLIEEYNLQESFILLGANPNPYPYIEQCDIYVQPSRYEGYCITLIEARCLKKPIVTTDVNGAKEQIIDGKNGFIVNIDEIEIYNAILKYIKNSDLREKFITELSKESFDNSIEMKKLFNVIKSI